MRSRKIQPRRHNQSLKDSTRLQANRFCHGYKNRNQRQQQRSGLAEAIIQVSTQPHGRLFKISGDGQLCHKASVNTEGKSGKISYKCQHKLHNRKKRNQKANEYNQRSEGVVQNFILANKTAREQTLTATPFSHLRSHVLSQIMLIDLTTNIYRRTTKDKHLSNALQETSPPFSNTKSRPFGRMGRLPRPNSIHSSSVQYTHPIIGGCGAII